MESVLLALKLKHEFGIDLILLLAALSMISMAAKLC